MKFLRRAALLLLIGEPAYGQTFQFPAMVPLTPEYVVTQQMFRFIYPQSPSGGFVDVLQQSRPLSDFASSAELAQRSALFAHQMRRDFNRLSEGIALSAAVTILPPNPGDRFALTLSGTSYEGHGAASASFSYRAADGVLLFGAYSQGMNQGLVKAGASFSFR